MFEDLKNKTILITGASSGIGKACAIILSNYECNLILTGRNTEKLSATNNELKNKKGFLISSDLSTEEGINKLISELNEIKLDGIIHCAGIVKPLPLKFIKPHHVRDIFAINFEAPVLLTSTLLSKNKINNNASLVFISSISSQYPFYGGALYVSTKSALEAYAKTVALEYVNKKIRSNIISPALVDTAILEESKNANSEEMVNEYEKKYPFGFGKPEDVANMATFLISNASKWITGQNFTMDGGLLLNAK